MTKIDIYNANLCNEQFLFYEMRIVAKLMVEGLKVELISSGRKVSNNMFSLNFYQKEAVGGKVKHVHITYFYRCCG